MSDVFTRLRRRLRFGPPVIVVTGLPRSGTSMVMRMLEVGGVQVTTDEVRGADEDNPMGYFEVERVKRLAEDADKSWLRESRGKAIKVISHLLRSLPHGNFYKVIFCERDLSEVLSSQNVMLQRRGEQNPIDDAAAKAHYERHLADIRLFIKVKRNMELLTVHYDEAIGDPQTFARRINAFLGGRLNVARMVDVVDRGLYRNRRKDPPHVAVSALSVALTLAVALIVAPQDAHAYIGPGAGFALVGSFFALLAAVVMSMLSMVLWPIRFVLRWQRRRKALKHANARRVVVLGLRRTGSESHRAMDGRRASAESLGARAARELHTPGDDLPGDLSGRMVVVHDGRRSRASQHLRLPRPRRAHLRPRLSSSDVQPRSAHDAGRRMADTRSAGR